MSRQWLTATSWHGARAPNPNSTSIHLDQLSEEERALVLSRYHYYYTSDWDWGLPTLGFFCAGIGVAVILNTIFRIRSWRSKAKAPVDSASIKPNVLDRITAAARYSVAQQYRVPLLNWYSPALAVIIALAGMWTFLVGLSGLSPPVLPRITLLLGLTLSVRPYYWTNPLMGHSPPIATRSGWISVGIMPLMMLVF
ncbi:hypothetical protein VKT23_001740 [Stygiomarasmius scandens]|uniref:Uncharacterized protein n=1 Tax=Marasmiellus scandens TaxID=2682957 RepID=A0ABR1K0C6_9AGAR